MSPREPTKTRASKSQTPDNAKVIKLKVDQDCSANIEKATEHQGADTARNAIDSDTFAEELSTQSNPDIEKTGKKHKQDKRTIEELAELLFAAAGAYKADDGQDENLYEGVHPHIHVVSVNTVRSIPELSDQESDSI